MKNIHILPTDQPSRLAFDTDENFYLLCEEPVFFKHQELVENRNIYITSSEEIKEGDYYLGDDDNIYNLLTTVVKNGRKIVLTTDQRLIKDGVQDIDDDFLKWFVKNPTCEFVEVQKWTNYSEVKYKLIIPQEEPKQDWYCPKCQSYVSSESVTFEETHQTCNTSVIIEEPKQESHICKYCNAETTQPDDECYAKPKQETKDIAYWMNNCEEDYLHTPISVLKYISELENLLGL